MLQSCAEDLFLRPFAHAVIAAEVIWTAGGLNILRGSTVFKVRALLQTSQSSHHSELPGVCTGCDSSGAFEDMYTGSNVLVSNTVYEAALSERGA